MPKRKIVKSKKTGIDTMGGQAVMGGVMMRSNTHWGVAVRTPEGKIETRTEKLKSITDKYKWMKKPFIRGTPYLVEMLIIGIKALTWSSQKTAGGEDETLSKSDIFWTITGSLALAVLMFIVLPFGLTALFFNKGVLFNIVDGILRATLFVLYLLTISFLEDVKMLFQYHGAEHKTVYCYEDEKKLTSKNVQKYSTRHSRCGSSFIIIVLLLSIIVYSLVVTDSWAIRLASRIVLLPVIAGISFEVLKWSSKHMDNLLVKPLIMPGLLIQLITTKEPTDKQVEVAIASMQAVLKASKI